VSRVAERGIAGRVVAERDRTGGVLSTGPVAFRAFGTEFSVLRPSWLRTVGKVGYVET
jgi:hypothetical protein